jgi:hypothetical protein
MRKSTAAAGLGMLLLPLLLVAIVLHLLVYALTAGDEEYPRVRASMQASVVLNSAVLCQSGKADHRLAQGWHRRCLKLLSGAAVV